jgi:hypothetical protein
MPGILANQIGSGQTDENHGHGRNTQSHTDPIMTQAGIAGRGIFVSAVISVVTTTVSMAMRNLSRPAATQLRFAFRFNVISDNRHNIL